jgi:hypothetical protein
LQTFSEETLQLSKKYAEQEFRLSAKQSDGHSLREHLEKVQEITKQVPEGLKDLVELPEEASQCWRWFLELNETRASGMGISAITFTEIKSFFELHWVVPEVEEVEMIKLFDRVAMKAMQEQNEKEQEKAKTKSTFAAENKNEGSP